MPCVTGAASPAPGPATSSPAPWQNPYVESFGGRLRDELLSVEAFNTLLEARVLVEDWRIEYNTLRPHSALGYLVWAPLGDLGVCESGDVGCMGLLELNRGAPAQGAVASLPVVEDLEVLKDRVGQLDAGSPPLAVQEFGLHPGPERLDDGVVVGVTDGAHRGQQPGLLGALGERPRSELRAVIAMDHGLLWPWVAMVDGHAQRIGN
jgi:hypothetical protein